MCEKYKTIIDLPHHQSATRSRMSNYDRAAQFAPFAALTGYEETTEETARLTEEFALMSEDKLANLSAKMQVLINNLYDRPLIEITYFVPDERKSGGAYATKKGNVRTLDESERKLVFVDGDRIAMDNIVEFSGEIFSVIE